jgi:hypothetical protein
VRFVETAHSDPYRLHRLSGLKSGSNKAKTPSITMKITTSAQVIITVRMVLIMFGRSQHLRWVGIS